MAVLCSNEVDSLMLRNRDFRVRTFETWAVLSSNEVDSLMLRNRVSRLRNVQKWEVPLRKGVDLSDVQEARIKFAKRTEMGSVFLQEGRFAFSRCETFKDGHCCSAMRSI